MNDKERDSLLRETRDAAILTNTRCESCRKTVCILDRAVRGFNDTPGLLGRVGKLEMAVLKFAASISLVILVAFVGWMFSKF